MYIDMTDMILKAYHSTKPKNPMISDAAMLKNESKFLESLSTVQVRYFENYVLNKEYAKEAKERELVDFVLKYLANMISKPPTMIKF